MIAAIPMIEDFSIDKIHIADEDLSKAARLELKLIKMQNPNDDGYRFRVKDDRCVIVGKDTGNDFHVIKAAAEIQWQIIESSGVVVDKFRFAFI